MARHIPLPGTQQPHRSLHSMSVAPVEACVGHDHAVVPHTRYSLVSARHLETAFFSVEPAESFTP